MNPDPICIKEMTTVQLSTFLPNLTPDNYQITSQFTRQYNCVAWALGIEDKWIDFYLTSDGEVSDDQSVTPYISFFQKYGFETCETGDLDPDLEKIALFENSRSEFTHVARQLPDGTWASKLGGYEDIEHTTIEAVAGVGRLRYGHPVIYMQRGKKKTDN